MNGFALAIANFFQRAPRIAFKTQTGAMIGNGNVATLQFAIDFLRHSVPSPIYNDLKVWIFLKSFVTGVWGNYNLHIKTMINVLILNEIYAKDVKLFLNSHNECLKKLSNYLIWRQRFQFQSVNMVGHFFGQGPIDQSLTLNPRQTFESFRNNLQGKVAFTVWMGATMPRVLG
jgi:hypothetical protein